MPVAIKGATSPFEDFVFGELAALPANRTEDIDCRLLSTAELILSNVVQVRFVHVTLEKPDLAPGLVNVISGLRKGLDRPADRDGMLVIPDILGDGINADLANRYLDKMEEVEDEDDPAYDAKDYLYLINSTKFQALVESDEQRSEIASAGMIESLADGADDLDKPMLLILSDEPMSFVAYEDFTTGEPEKLTNQANMEVVVNSKGVATSFSADPRIIEMVEPKLN